MNFCEYCGATEFLVYELDMVLCEKCAMFVNSEENEKNED